VLAAWLTSLTDGLQIGEHVAVRTSVPSRRPTESPSPAPARKQEPRVPHVRLEPGVACQRIERGSEDDHETERSFITRRFERVDCLVVPPEQHVAFWATYTATQSGPMGPFPPTGKRFQCEFAGIFHVEGGRITHLRLTWDNLGILMQLGHLQPMGSVQGDS
jgi:hypothetical protein